MSDFIPPTREEIEQARIALRFWLDNAYPGDKATLERQLREALDEEAA